MPKRKIAKVSLAIAATAGVLAAMVLLVYFALENKNNKQIIAEFGNRDYTLPETFTITAATGCLGTEENTYISARTGIRSGARVIQADISFRKDGTPVLAARLKDAEDAPELKLVFEYMKDYEEVSMLLNLKQVTNLPGIERLAEEYNLRKRLKYTGITAEHAAYIQYESPNIGYYLDVTPEKGKLNDPSYCAGLAELALSKTAEGINCPASLISETLVGAVRAYGLKVSVFGADKEIDLYESLALSVDNIITKEPKKLREIIDKWQGQQTPQ